jgi:hypothetical protein
MKNKNIIRYGDYVKVIVPETFVRCGYPLTLQIVKDTLITPEQKDAIRKMMIVFGPNPTRTCEDLFREIIRNGSKVYDNILTVMAKCVIADKGWVGENVKYIRKTNQNY